MLSYFYRNLVPIFCSRSLLKKTFITKCTVRCFCNFFLNYFRRRVSAAATIIIDVICITKSIQLQLILFPFLYRPKAKIGRAVTVMSMPHSTLTFQIWNKQIRIFAKFQDLRPKIIELDIKMIAKFLSPHYTYFWSSFL